MSVTTVPLLSEIGIDFFLDAFSSCGFTRAPIRTCTCTSRGRGHAAGGSARDPPTSGALAVLSRRGKRQPAPSPSARKLHAFMRRWRRCACNDSVMFVMSPRPPCPLELSGWASLPPDVLILVLKYPNSSAVPELSTPAVVPMGPFSTTTRMT